MGGECRTHRGRGFRSSRIGGFLYQGKKTRPFHPSGHRPDRPARQRLAAAEDRCFFPFEAGPGRTGFLPDPWHLGLFTAEHHDVDVTPISEKPASQRRAVQADDAGHEGFVLPYAGSFGPDRLCCPGHVGSGLGLHIGRPVLHPVRRLFSRGMAAQPPEGPAGCRRRCPIRRRRVVRHRRHRGKCAGKSAAQRLPCAEGTAAPGRPSARAQLAGPHFPAEACRRQRDPARQMGHGRRRPRAQRRKAWRRP